MLERARAGVGGPALKRLAWFSDWGDKALFIVFFVGGFGVILAAKLAVGVAPTMAAWLAAGLLLLYAALAWTVPQLRLHADRLGDNCYYLGLLYTLASLAAALMQINATASAVARAALIDGLLASFGVALVSTILGIALRVFFLQMRREVDDLEQELQREITTRATQMKDQMILAVTELESFRLRTQQVLTERLTEATARHTAAADDQVAAVQALVARILEGLEKAFAAHAENARALNEASKSLIESGAELQGRLRAVEVPRDLLIRRADAVGQRFDQAAERIGTAADGLAAKLNAVEVPTDLLEARTNRLSAAMSVATASFDRIASIEAARLSALEKGTGSAGESVKILTSSVEALATAVTRLQKSIGDLSALEASIPPVLDATARLRAGLDAQAEAVSAMAGRTAEDAKLVAEYRERLLNDLNESRRALGQTQETMTQIVRVIADKLGG